MKKLKWFFIILVLFTFACSTSPDTSPPCKKTKKDLPAYTPIKRLEDANGWTTGYIYKFNMDGNEYLVVMSNSDSYSPAITQIK